MTLRKQTTAEVAKIKHTLSLRDYSILRDLLRKNIRLLPLPLKN